MHRFNVTVAPTEAPDALVLEVAITEVVPSKVTLNALGYAPFGVGIAVKAIRGIAKDRSSVAMEARLRDASTGEILATAADREAEQATLVSARGLTWYSHAHGIVDAWARQFAQVANRRSGEVIEDTKIFTLKPW